MTNAMKKFVVWDWNGTLLDDTDIVLDSINVVLAKMGSVSPVSMDALRETHTMSFRELYLELGVPEEKIDDPEAHHRDIFHDHYESRSDRAPLRAGAVGLLQRLKTNDVSNIILSNHITDQIVRLLKRSGIHNLFDRVTGYASRESQFRDMTKGERLRRHIEAEGLNASNALIVGDTCEEIGIARVIGMGSVAITGGLRSEERLRSMNPDHLIHSFDDMVPILRQRGFVS